LVLGSLILALGICSAVRGALALCGIGGFMALVGLWVRRKGAQGIGTMG
jgi:hypothetical protein